MIITGGRGQTSKEGVEDTKQDLGRKVRDGTPCGEGDTIRARSRIVRGADRTKNLIIVRSA